MNIYLVTRITPCDYIGIPEHFTPEAYATEEQARDQALNLELRDKQYGFEYDVEKIEVQGTFDS